MLFGASFTMIPISAVIGRYRVPSRWIDARAELSLYKSAHRISTDEIQANAAAGYPQATTAAGCDASAAPAMVPSFRARCVSEKRPACGQ
jgi:hypothetical protein